MSDLIERQAAIDSIKFYYKSVNWAEEYKDIIEVITNDYIEMIDKLPSAQPEPQWIPCSERLPDDLGDYLVSIKRIGWNMEEYDMSRMISHIGMTWKVFTRLMKSSLGCRFQSHTERKGELMSRLDQDREDLIRLIISICDYARLGYNISTHNNCNNCKDKECQYKPDWGDSVRWNCPLWKGGE